jgi:hypothetical protein
VAPVRRDDEMIAEELSAVNQFADQGAVRKEYGNIMANKTHKIGRDARTGHFMPVSEARKRPATTVVETIKNRKK